jgi:hypothetical protein
MKALLHPAKPPIGSLGTPKGACRRDVAATGLGYRNLWPLTWRPSEELPPELHRTRVRHAPSNCIAWRHRECPDRPPGHCFAPVNRKQPEKEHGLSSEPK